MPISPQEALARVIVHREIFYDEMVELMRQVMRGEVSPVMTAALLTGLRVKKETVGEIAGAAAVMREFAAKVEVSDRSKLVDIVGTGGDGANTFNIHRIVTHHASRLAEPIEIPSQVVHEAVVVIDQQNHGSSARTNPVALCQVSSYSC